jgi:hypothetical protein
MGAACDAGQTQDIGRAGVGAELVRRSARKPYAFGPSSTGGGQGRVLPSGPAL